MHRARAIVFRHTAGILFCALAMAGAQPASAQEEAARFAQAYDRIDAFVAQHMKANGTPGVTLAITSREGLLRVATYGFADIKSRRPVTPDTLFEIGSISKSFTAICLLQLREEGKIDFQQPVTKYLPWFSVQSKFEPITVHHLLTHTSGIPRDRDDIPSSPFQAAALSERETGYPPGKKYAYSNIGFQVLGYMLGEIEGQPSYDVVRRRVIEPLGMKATETSIRQEMRAKLATGYEPFYDDRPENVADGLTEVAYGDYGAGDGAISSTPADLATYVRMLLNRGAVSGATGTRARLLSEESFALLTQRAIPTNSEGTSFYGYGMRTWQMDGHTMVGHDGGMIGYTSTIKADMDAGLGVVVFLNGPGDPGEIGEFALRAARAAKEKAELPPIPTPEAPTRVLNASEYAGIYSSADGEKLAFVAQGPSLSLVYKGERILLERRGRDSFFADDPDFRLFLLQFGREEKKADSKEPAKVIEVFYGSEWFTNDSYIGPRTFETPKEWQDYVGHYRSYSPWISNLRIGLRKGKLVLLNPGGAARILVPLASGEFQPGEGPTAERFRFEARAGGKAVRLSDSGVYLYKTFTP